MNEGLSSQDIAALARDPSAESRARIVRKISEQYRQRKLNDNERTIAAEIFAIVVNDSDSGVRLALSDGLKSCIDAPRDVILALAEDEVDTVALPILRDSITLTEDELIQIIRNTNVQIRLVTIAGRDTMQSSVADALVDKQIKEVVITLVRNQGAEISEEGFDKAADDFYDSEELLRSLLKRHPVPTRAVKRCVDNAMKTAKKSIQIRQMNEWDKSDGQNLSPRGVLRDMQSLLQLGSSPSAYACEKLVKSLQSVGRLGPHLLVSALCLGHMKFFTAVMARQAHVPYGKASRICKQPNGALFHTLYERTELPSNYLPYFEWLLLLVQELSSKHLIEANNPESAAQIAAEMESAMEIGMLPPNPSLQKVLARISELGSALG